MKLLTPLPSDRSFEQIKNHYLVEKTIAERLKKSNRKERTIILSTMYDELFSKVPDHPRLKRRNDENATLQANKSKSSIVRRYLSESVVFLEFASGDCKFAFEVAKKVKYYYGVDISDQRNPTDDIPDNFKLIIYDGNNLEQLENNSIDIVFSDQLIEHLHEEDTRLHFEIVQRLLKRGGKYAFRTPHSFNGPSDVSRYFSNEPEGFHLKEWTYVEIRRMLMELKYSGFHAFWNAKGLNFRMPDYYFEFLELFLGKIHKRYLRRFAKYLIPSLSGVAIK